MLKSLKQGEGNYLVLLKSYKSNCVFPRITVGGDMNNLYEYCK